MSREVEIRISESLAKIKTIEPLRLGNQYRRTSIWKSLSLQINRVMWDETITWSRLHRVWTRIDSVIRHTWSPPDSLGFLTVSTSWDPRLPVLHTTPHDKILLKDSTDFMQRGLNFCDILFIITDNLVKWGIRGEQERRCRCYERQRGKSWEDWSLSHTRWSGGSVVKEQARDLEFGVQ